MKKFTNLFEVVCDSRSEAEIMQLKNHLLIILMEALKKQATKRKDMAIILGVSNGEMSRIANGYLSSISIEKLLKHLSTVGFSTRPKLNVENVSVEIIINGDGKHAE